MQIRHIQTAVALWVHIAVILCSCSLLFFYKVLISQYICRQALIYSCMATQDGIICNSCNVGSKIHYSMWTYLLQFQIFLSGKYPYPCYREFFFVWTPPPSLPSLWEFQFWFILSLLQRKLAFETPFPHGIPNNPPWGGYGCFLEPHNVVYDVCTQKQLKFTLGM